MKTWNIGYSKWLDYQKWHDSVLRFEKAEVSSEELLKEISQQLIHKWREQHELGVDSIPMNDFGIWDRLLETAWLFGLVPKSAYEFPNWVQAFYFLTRGDKNKELPGLRKASWFRTGYHCFLPAWKADEAISLHTERLDWELEIQKDLPYPFHFSLLGPWTLSQLCEISTGNRSELLQALVPLYIQVLKHLKKKGFQRVQIEEPGLCRDLDKLDIKQVSDAYTLLTKNTPSLFLSTYYESFDPWLSELCSLPVQGIHFDCVKGPAVLSWLKTRAFPRDKSLVLGILDAQNIWSSPLASIHKQLEILKGFHSPENIWLAPSAPLWHLPHTKENEKALAKNSPLVFQSISFARERLEELMKLKRLQNGSLSIKEIQKNEDETRKRWRQINQSREGLRRELSKLDFSFRKRGASFAKRQKLQRKKYPLPPLPIFLTGNPTELSLDEQSELGIDWLCKQDESFNELLTQTVMKREGFELLEAGWVPFCGNQGVKPPLLVSDVVLRKENENSENEPVNAQKKPTKSVVLGPISLLAHSFCRQDLSWDEVALQLAWATRQEVVHCETLGFEGVEIWEAEMIAGSPQKKQKVAVYQKHLLDIMKLAASGVRDDSTIILNVGNLSVQGWEEFFSKVDVDTILFESIPHKGLILETNVGVGIIDSKNMTPQTESDIDFEIRKVCQVVSPHKLWISVGRTDDCIGNKTHRRDEIKCVVAATLKLRKLLQKN